MQQYFITGTDTDCGKTYVTGQLLHYLKNQNKSVMAIKPIASGCFEQNGHLISADALYLEKYNEPAGLEINPWRYKQPISPHLAAKQQGERISSQAIAEFCADKTFANLDYLLIEGAGGLMVPLNLQETWINFLKHSGIEVIFIVGMRLGCLNHALLTELALKVHHIPCKGWIANCIDKDMMALDENIKTLSNRMNIPLLATIPYKGQLTHKIAL